MVRGVTKQGKSPASTILMAACSTQIKWFIATNATRETNLANSKRRVIPIRSAMIATEETAWVTRSFRQSEITRPWRHGAIGGVLSTFRQMVNVYCLAAEHFGKGDQPQLYSKYLQDFNDPYVSSATGNENWLCVVGLCGVHLLTMCRTLAKWTICINAMGYCGSGRRTSQLFWSKNRSTGA